MVVPNSIERVELILLAFNVSFANYCAIGAHNSRTVKTHKDFKVHLGKLDSRHRIPRSPRNIPYVIELDPVAIHRSPCADLHGRPCPSKGADPTVRDRREVRQEVQIASYVMAIYD